MRLDVEEEGGTMDTASWRVMRPPLCSATTSLCRAARPGLRRSTLRVVASCHARRLGYQGSENGAGAGSSAPAPAVAVALPANAPAAPASSSATSPAAKGPVPLTRKVSGSGVRMAAKKASSSARGTTPWSTQYAAKAGASAGAAAGACPSRASPSWAHTAARLPLPKSRLCTRWRWKRGGRGHQGCGRQWGRAAPLAGLARVSSGWRGGPPPRRARRQRGPGRRARRRPHRRPPLTLPPRAERPMAQKVRREGQQLALSVGRQREWAPSLRAVCSPHLVRPQHRQPCIPPCAAPAGPPPRRRAAPW